MMNNETNQRLFFVPVFRCGCIFFNAPKTFCWADFEACADILSTQSQRTFNEIASQIAQFAPNIVFSHILN